jgi:hypothetical protein
MIDFVTRYISTISLAVAATLSIFNIGYFWKIGLPFLGLMDLSNLVYSLGVSLTVLSIGVFIASRIIKTAAGSVPLQIVIAGVGAALSMWGIIRFSPRTLEPQLLDNAAILLGFVLSASAFASRVWDGQAWNWRNATSLIIVWSIIMFQAGVCQAALDMTDRFKYAVSTKSGVIDNARILRSSSSGLLLLADGKIRFVPQGEVKDVTSQTSQ